jgi:hypothetical protein
MEQYKGDEDCVGSVVSEWKRRCVCEHDDRVGACSGRTKHFDGGVDGEDRRGRGGALDRWVQGAGASADVDDSGVGSDVQCGDDGLRGRQYYPAPHVDVGLDAKVVRSGDVAAFWSMRVGGPGHPLDPPSAPASQIQNSLPSGSAMTIHVEPCSLHVSSLTLVAPSPIRRVASASMAGVSMSRCYDS